MKSFIIFLIDSLVLIGMSFFRINTCLDGSSKNEKLVILQLDHIGDFIIFTDTLKYIRNMYPNDGWDIILVGFEEWENLIEPMCSNHNEQLLDEFIPIKMKKMKNNYKYRFSKLKKIINIKSNVLINPNISRTPIMDELVMFSHSKLKIGFRKNGGGLFSKYADLYYSKLLKVKYPIPHEISVYRNFFTQLGFKLNSPPETRLYWYENDVAKVNLKINDDFVVISPLSGNVRKNWEFRKFNEVIDKLIKIGLKVYLVGSCDQQSIIENKMSSAIENGAINVAGLFSLRQTAYLISKSSLVIGNDSMAIHMAVATNTRSVCILPGMDYGRYFPYPKMGNYNIHKIVSLGLDCFGCNWICKHKITKNQSFPCLSNVSVKLVLDEVKGLLSS